MVIQASSKERDLGDGKENRPAYLNKMKDNT